MAHANHERLWNRYVGDIAAINGNGSVHSENHGPLLSSSPRCALAHLFTCGAEMPCALGKPLLDLVAAEFLREGSLWLVVTVVDQGGVGEGVSYLPVCVCCCPLGY